MVKKKTSSRPQPVNHSLITYVPLDIILRALDFHSEQILAWALIKHDKDTFTAEDEEKNPEHIAGTIKEPHYHVLIRTYKKCYSKSVCKWFWYIDDNGPVSTLAERAFTVTDAYNYLTHKYEPDKYQYPDDAVMVSDPKWFEIPDLAEADNLTIAYMNALLDVDPFLLVKRFGRDFIVHQRDIYNLVERTKEWSARSPARRDELYRHLNEVDFNERF